MEGNLLLEKMTQLQIEGRLEHLKLGVRAVGLDDDARAKELRRRAPVGHLACLPGPPFLRLRPHAAHEARRRPASLPAALALLAAPPTEAAPPLVIRLVPGWQLDGRRRGRAHSSGGWLGSP
eukprot:COSAG05_NODE_1535_length_4614_cov_342.629900_1_plen_122_part_00